MRSYYSTSSCQVRWPPCHQFSNCKSVTLRCRQHVNIQETIPSYVKYLQHPFLQCDAWWWSSWESWAMVVIDWCNWGHWQDQGPLPHRMADPRWQSTWSVALWIVPGSMVPKCDDKRKMTTWEHNYLLQRLPVAMQMNPWVTLDEHHKLSPAQQALWMKAQPCWMQCASPLVRVAVVGHNLWGNCRTWILQVTTFWDSQQGLKDKHE